MLSTGLDEARSPLPLFFLFCRTLGWFLQCRLCWPPGRGSSSSATVKTWSPTGNIQCQVKEVQISALNFFEVCTFWWLTDTSSLSAHAVR